MTSRLARDPARRCLAVGEWPERDRTLWLAAVRPGGPLLQRGGRARRAASSNHAVEGGYGRFLAWLRHNGRLDVALSPAARITQDAVDGYLQVLAAVNSTATQLRRLEELHIAAKVMNPGADWQWIRDLAAQVRLHHQPTRDKRPRIVGVDDLEGLGLSLMQQAERGPNSPRRRALLHRDGLAIALLIARPLRRTNFAGLRLDDHLERQGGRWWLKVPRSETKNRSPINMPFPEDLVPHLETYLAVHRPVLLARPSRWSASRPPDRALWVSDYGSAMGAQALYDLVEARTRRAFGRSLSPHLFRDCAATGIAIEDPAHVRIGSPLLGHRSHATLGRHYNQAGSVEAARQWHRTLARLRKQPRPSAAPGR